MTTVEATKQHGHYRIEIDNHADSKIVCAGVSAIVFALAGAVSNNPAVLTHYERFEPGHAVIDYLSDDPLGEEDMRMCVIGLKQIQLSHPEEITITENII